MMGELQEKSTPQKSSTQDCIKKEHTYGAHNYHPLPVVFSKAQGIYVYDPEGRKYMDFLSAYSAVNQGHCHPKIIKALVDQANTLTLSSRAFYNDVFGNYAKYITEFFGFDMVLPMNTGAEGVETAVKLARKWAYQTKGVPKDQAIVLFCTGNFHGRTLGVISASTDPSATSGFGPLIKEIGSICPSTGQSVEFNNVESLEAALSAHGKNVAGFLVEPIQYTDAKLGVKQEYMSLTMAI
jgi:ornithine--oxo-acid transaminase